MYCLVIFFFFKQKTAYDLRISDWSSDVCSSDLKVFIGRLPPSSLRRRGPARTASPRPRLLGTPQLPGRTALEFGQPQDEIGRAWCRESVCQYVSISVDAVSLKKKKDKSIDIVFFAQTKCTHMILENDRDC